MLSHYLYFIVFISKSLGPTYTQVERIIGRCEYQEVGNIEDHIKDCQPNWIIEIKMDIMNNLKIYIKNQNSKIHEVFTQHISLYRLETQGIE